MGSLSMVLCFCFLVGRACGLFSFFYSHYYAIGPIIDPHEFRDRFIASYHAKLAATAPASSSSGSRPHPKTQYKATDELTLLANVLVTWAASYGIDEFGHEDADAAAQDAVVSNVSNGTIGGGDTRSGRVGDESSEQAVADAAARKKRRRLRVTEMVKEILQGVDQLALLRRPTWDGVRVLMLVMPLTEGESSSSSPRLVQPPPLCVSTSPPLSPLCLRRWGWGNFISRYFSSPSPPRF